MPQVYTVTYTNYFLIKLEKCGNFKKRQNRTKQFQENTISLSLKSKMLSGP